jgi:CubicO group peptidase (beta-lactamase class C family)
VPADPLDLCQQLVARGVVGGLQVAYARGDHAPTVACFGAAALDSRFALASLTKPLVAMACLVAYDEGVLDLDVPVTTYVSEALCTATLRELLAHASGLPADSPDARRAQLAADGTWATVAAAYAALVPATAPRTERIYSNAGYALAALALERASAMSYHAYLDAAILTPLEMANTSLGASVDSASPIEVVQPGLLGHGQQLFNGTRFRALGLPQSGGFGTAADYLRLLTCVAGQGLPLLDGVTRLELLTNQCGALAGGVGDFMEWPVCDWAVGFEVRNGKTPHWTGDALSPGSVTHFGAAGTLAFIDPERDVQAVVLANRGTYSRWMLEPGGWPDICAALVA